MVTFKKKLLNQAALQDQWVFFIQLNETLTKLLV